MELSLQKNPVFINEIILDETVEQPIECDALLPDYCPDIRRILKCSMSPVVMSKAVTAGRLEVEGIAGLNILYLSAGGELAKGEYKVPFSRMLELHGNGENPMITVTLRTGQLNCRAVNQRRLDIRGSVVIRAVGITSREDSAICGSEEPTLRLRRREKTGMRLAGQAEREQRLTQATTLSGSGSPISRVLRCDACICRREDRVADGRVIVRGEIQATVLCAGEDGGWEKAECTLPFETTVELPGACDATPCEIWQELLSATAEPGTDSDGEYRSISWDITVVTRVRIYRPYTGTICTDCYSTRFASSGRNRNIQTLQLLSLCNEAVTSRETLELPEQMEEIIAIWPQGADCTVHPEGEGLLAEGRLGLTLLCKMSDGELYSFDRTLEVQHHVTAAEGAQWNARLECRGCQWEFHGGTELSVNCDLFWSGAVWNMCKETMLEEVTVDEKRPRTDAMPRGLYIYMAQKSESLWDIARRYNTSEEKIREDNGDLGEECAGGAILIPV